MCMPQPHSGSATIGVATFCGVAAIHINVQLLMASACPAGTQHIFEEDDTVLYMSLHRYDKCVLRLYCCLRSCHSCMCHRIVPLLPHGYATPGVRLEY